MQTTMNTKVYTDRKVWFSMWFLGAIVTFGVAFFPMFYRLVEGRNRHFQKERALEQQVNEYLKFLGKEPLVKSQAFKAMSSKAWAASIILIVPVFVIVYLLSKDLVVHERTQDEFLVRALPERVFMTQTIPIKKYAVVTLVTLGVGVIYWLYKVVNLYNAHFKADLQVEKEIARLMEAKAAVKQL
jgi:hypothetical protein